MTFLWALVAVIATTGLVSLEWRRANPRNVACRCAATILAATALLLLSSNSPLPGASRPQTETSLWTTASTRATSNSPTVGTERWALPDAASDAPRGTRVAPDAGTLRRHLPNLRTLHIFGDGLDPSELPALAGLHVLFHSPDHSLPPTPSVTFLACPSTLFLGETLVLSGRLSGVPPGSRFPLALDSPDGRKSETLTDPSDAYGDATFSLQTAPPSDAGRFEWGLRVGPTTETLGVCVVSPTLPRVLVLEGAPHFDTAALRRWFAGAGGTLTTRTQVGKEAQRFASTPPNTPEFSQLDAPLLAKYDLVFADGAALTALNPEERRTLAAAVAKTGLGLLVFSPDAISPPESPDLPADLRQFLPWKFHPIGDIPSGEDRPVRLRWHGQTIASDIPVSALPVALDAAGGQDVLISDREANTLAASFGLGRGRIATTLVRETTRWQRENAQEAFAAYWSFLFSRLARPSDNTAGQWSFADGDQILIFVDHPLQLRWSGPPDAIPGPALVTTVPAEINTPLPLAQDPRDRGDWRTTFWPRRAGWHRVASASGTATLDFYIHPSDAWLSLQAARRRFATARFAALSAVASGSPLSQSSRQGIHPGWWFALFVLASGYLWTERRFAVARL